jgi:hypothetical protein
MAANGRNVLPYCSRNQVRAPATSSVYRFAIVAVTAPFLQGSRRYLRFHMSFAFNLPAMVPAEGKGAGGTCQRL